MSGYRERGPAPKRDAERVRNDSPDQVKTTTVHVSELISREVLMPMSHSDWHHVATQWYESLAESAQCVYYEPSDWSTAYVVADWLSQKLQPQVISYDEERGRVVKAVVPMKGADMTAFLKAATNLLVTEVDRRRAGIEIERVVQLRDVEQGGGEADIVDFAAARAASVGN